MDTLLNWLLGIAHSPWGPVALFLTAFMEASFFPISPDLIFFPLCIAWPPGSFLFALICTGGSFIGGLLGYLMGLKGGRPLVQRLVGPQKVQAADNLYRRYGVWAIGMAGIVPLPYNAFTISAGLFTLEFPKFFVASLVGRAWRFFLVGALLFFFGPAFEQYLREHQIGVLLAILVSMGVGLLLINYFSRKNVVHASYT